MDEEDNLENATNYAFALVMKNNEAKHYFFRNSKCKKFVNIFDFDFDSNKEEENINMAEKHQEYHCYYYPVNEARKQINLFFEKIFHLIAILSFYITC